MADDGLQYTYSGLTLQPHPWSAAVLEVKAAVEQLAGCAFNSCLLNHYRSGEDHMSWHSDNEPLYGQQPVIASVSFGDTRDFVLRHNIHRTHRLTVPLASGDVLTMSGTTQQHWQHCVPKRRKVLGPRINLTFRNIIRPEGPELALARTLAKSSCLPTIDKQLQVPTTAEHLPNTDRNTKMSGADFELRVQDGGIYWGSERVSIKGVNWFGFETADFALHGLWCTNMLQLLDFTAQHFNAIRLPFSCELALNMDARQPGNIDYAANPELQGLTTGQVVDRFIQECARRGLLVLLDMHRLAAAQDIPELWYSAEYPESAVLQGWKTMVLRYKDCWNVFAADLNNEPHGCASWGDGNLRTDWQLAAARIGAVILEANPRLLIFVEGVERNGCVQPCENCWWGGHIAGAAKAPVALPVEGKLVYSPHVYGPDVFGQPYFSDPSFPDNMPDVWSRHFGFIKQEGHGPAICPGEWGGWAKEGGSDAAWQVKLADWFVEHGITDSFYWCLNPNSGDTGGILQEDWATPHQHKLDIVARAHPNPTKWPQDEVTPAAPAPEDCQVESTVDPAAFGGAPAACAAEPAAAGAEPAAPVAAAVPAAPLSAGEVEVTEVNAWDEGAVRCFQLEAKVTNTGPGPASSMRLRVAAAEELQKAWNATQLPDEGGFWVFDFPDWVGPSGGLAVGANVVVGLIVKGEKPTEFAVV
ncbi:hypothetical protein OEZ85_008120 [Tetradesmus obliquus]|uniref:cellulase n=1 Tax=Tetradesmus obliquus TaxID=3088 RepID=A0ABY8TI61_TETOB|nr:hypothetical protein OEZ85_008120 [Tetradesmus obliquus]